MAEFVFTMQDLRKVVSGDRVILDDITLAFFPGAKIGVIGGNGAGKSSLLRIMAGVDTEFVGEARPTPGVTVGWLPQEPELDPAKDVRGNVEEGVGESRELLRRFEELSARFAEPLEDDEMNALLEEQSKLQDAIDASGAWELDRTLEVAMEALRVPPGDQDVATLSGGERRRVALCRLLLQKPELLLLDEPTNHLDAETVAWLEQTLAEYRGAVIVITHDRFFLDRVVDWMLEVFHSRCIPYKGNYSIYLEQKAKNMRQQESSERKRGKFLERELEWIRMNPKARTAKNKSRIKNYEAMADRVVEEKDGSVELQIPSGKRLGDLVLRFQKVNFSYGDNHVIRDVSFDLQPGDILGVVGPNGTGKTTLLKLITGKLEPDSGTVTVGKTVELCHLDQERESLDPDHTVWQEITGGHEFLKLGKLEINSRSYVAKFNFTGPDQQQKVGTLSGGQRNRVQLAKMLRRGGNLILLDEPTNDLDLDTLRVLEEGIQNFPGCMVVVSHDRYFLDRICSRIIDLGNYEPGHFLDSI